MTNRQRRRLMHPSYQAGGGSRPVLAFKTVPDSDASPKPAKDSSRISARPSLPLPCGPSGLPPDLNLVIERWTSLPEAVRAGIVAMVQASSFPSRDRRVPDETGE